ncbi:AraC family transcriptional regulator [Paenibacillus baekrokdamisoli]|uniref:AraC family transcriptional regulator n=1 Tax=Paenibacillus baekrokdamisoli TaxID=1712516 RepID=A0A3G9IJG7_9BACL|nr:AraC family transcriptional regulator [Paenibacillus baekrokdamisoli]MBB3067667.1 AraC-like DNA-binding protein [Paenibacillus baekrokdamisoli]BBH19147.1 AraC family transcriptional regulator [Paenibacillus baekrokdamisoli]
MVQIEASSAIAPIMRKIDLLNLAPYVRFVQELWNKIEEIVVIPPRVIYDYEIIFLMEGTGEFHINDKKYYMKPGNVFIIPPHVRHSYSISPGKAYHYFAVHFDLLYMGESLDFSADHVYRNIDYKNLNQVPLEQQLSDRPVVVLNEINFPVTANASDPHKYLQLFRELVLASQEKQLTYPIEARALMLQILKYLIRDCKTKEGIEKEHSHKIEMMRAIQYMYDHYQEDLNVHDLSHSLALSTNYFRTLFKEATGKTPLEFHTHIRMDKAKEYLKKKKHSIGEICDLVGYNNIYNFSRIFKKAEGISPKFYADTLRDKTAML